MAALLLCCFALTWVPAQALTMNDLPDPVDWSRSVTAPSFSMTGIGGDTLTSGGYGAGRNLILVYGRIWCGNTRAFLNGLSPAMDLLDASGVTVLVGLFSEPTDEEMAEFAETFPGIVCGRVSNYYYESGMWTGLEAWTGGDVSSVTFPVVFLRDDAANLRYCSTGYVWEPLPVAAAAIAMAKQHDEAAFVLPEELAIIEAEAFRGGSFASVQLGEHVTAIGDYAFADNPALRWVYIPASVTSISDSAFSGCSGVELRGPSGSAAQAYARKMGIPFTVKQ